MKTIYSLTLLMGLFITTLSAQANKEHMCGNGEFEVQLSSRSIFLPNDCSMYSLIVSGYSRNKSFDELTVYHYAKFVAENNGYVHYSWWNDLLKPYMAGALYSNNATPGGLVSKYGLGFVPSIDRLPKAIPEEDYIFQSDAKKWLQAVRTNNPDAIITVVGHSMGGGSIVRLGAATNVEIDLLAPIDPVGNRSIPEGKAGRTYNWTRWRAAHAFRGYKRWIAVNTGYTTSCIPTGDWITQLKDVVPYTYSPQCIFKKGAYIDRGIPLSFKSNIKRLYHRWQKENVFPFDFGQNYPIVYAPKNSPTLIGDDATANFQKAYNVNSINESNSFKTCPWPRKRDPRDDFTYCNPSDGHGEMLGFRGIPETASFSDGLTGQHWEYKKDPSQRKDLFLEMPSANEPWNYAPLKPYLDMVSPHLIGITKEIIKQKDIDTSPIDTTAPSSVASPTELATEYGWYSHDVDIHIIASDNLNGSGVKNIQYSIDTDNSATKHISGDRGKLTLTKEGIHTISYFAVDNNNNQEEAKTLTVSIDKTKPSLVEISDIEANNANWFKQTVTYDFIATDELSGIAQSTKQKQIDTEGVNQKIEAQATDKAGNSTYITVYANVDLTPPKIYGLPQTECLLWPVNKKEKHVATLIGDDEMSGLSSLLITGENSEDSSNSGMRIVNGEVYLISDRNGKGTSRTYTINVEAADIADNISIRQASCLVPHDRRKY